MPHVLKGRLLQLLLQNVALISRYKQKPFHQKQKRASKASIGLYNMTFLTSAIDTG